MVTDNFDLENGLAPVISLGAGVQSSTMAMMADQGLIKPMPCAAVFSDTGGEPPSVYRWLDELRKMIRNFPIVTAKANGPPLHEVEVIVRTSKKSGKRYRRSMIPAFTASGGMLPRKCTRDFKVYPVLRKTKELASVPRGCKVPMVSQWIGISTDEAHRMKDSRELFAVNRWPLIEMGMSRADCLMWWKKRGLATPPRSSCVYCPYHSDEEWTRLRDDEPKAFRWAIELEKAIQAVRIRDEVATGGEIFLHSSRRPLENIRFDDSKPSEQLSLWGNECEGMCGI